MLMDIKTIRDKYDIEFKNVLHVGAHYGQEHQSYLDIGVREITYFEPQRRVYEILKSHVGNHLCINKALGSSVGTVSMHCEDANQGMSSSVLKPEIHAVQYPHIVFNHVEEVEMSTLDIEVKENKLKGFNTIVIDVQGYELEVFKGAHKTLSKIDHIYTEVNRASVYSGCVLVEELDAFLGEYGFVRVETDWAGSTWGDAFYTKKDR